MSEFDYIRPETLHSALVELYRLGENALILAGGTNIMVNIRLGKLNSGTMLDVTEIPELKGVELKDGRIRIGAATTVQELAGSELLREQARALYEAANHFAEATTRRSATIGGNVGNASSGGDLLPPLLALDAEVRLHNLFGERTARLEDLFLRPGKLNKRADELITYIEFMPTGGTGFVKLGARNTMTISIATAAAWAEMSGDGRIDRCRIALGAVSPVPVRAAHAEEVLTGSKMTQETFQRLSDVIQQDINPRNPSVRASVAYRRAIVPELVWRALQMACPVVQAPAR